MQLTKGAIGNLINRYKAVLKKCHLMNTFGSLAVAGMLVMGGAGVAAGAADVALGAGGPYTATDEVNHLMGGGLYKDNKLTADTAVASDITLSVEGGSISEIIGGSYISGTNADYKNATHGTITTIISGETTSAEFVVGGSKLANNDGATLETGTTAVTISGGIFGTEGKTNAYELVMGGNYIKTGTGASGTATTDGSSVTVNGGTFHASVVGGSVAHNYNGAGITNVFDNGNTSVTITGGTFNPSESNLADSNGGINLKAAVIGGGLAYGANTSTVLGSKDAPASSSVSISGDKTVINGKVVAGSVVANEGYAAIVHGDTLLSMRGGTVSDDLVGGGMVQDAATLPAGSTQPDSNLIVTGNAGVTVAGGTAKGEIVGGNYVRGDGSARVKNSTVSITGGTFAAAADSQNKAQYVIGGNKSMAYAGDTAKTLVEKDSGVLVDGDVTIADGAVVGGSMAKAEKDGKATATVEGNSSVTVNNATSLAGVVGGGLAETYSHTNGGAATSSVGGTSSVTINGGTINGIAYGAVAGNAGTSSAAVVGGGLANDKGSTATVGSTSVTIADGTINGKVVAGGAAVNGGSSTVTRDTSLTMTGGKVDGDLIGGGFVDMNNAENNQANVGGSTHITVSGGSLVDAEIIGGGSVRNATGEANVTGDTHVTVTKYANELHAQQWVQYVLGGGKAMTSDKQQTATAKVTGNTYVTIGEQDATGEALKIELGTVAGGGLARAQEGGGSATATVTNANVTVHSGILSGVAGDGIAENYGTDSADATVTNANLTINGGAINGVKYNGGNKSEVAVLGGGIAKGSGATATAATTNTVINGGTITGHVVAGGLADGGTATVGTANLTITDGTINGNVYAGGYTLDNGTANVTTANVTLKGGSINGKVTVGNATNATITLDGTGAKVTGDDTGDFEGNKNSTLAFNNYNGTFEKVAIGFGTLAVAENSNVYVDALVSGQRGSDRPNTGFFGAPTPTQQEKPNPTGDGFTITGGGTITTEEFHVSPDAPVTIEHGNVVADEVRVQSATLTVGGQSTSASLTVNKELITEDKNTTPTKITVDNLGTVTLGKAIVLDDTGELLSKDALDKIQTQVNTGGTLKVNGLDGKKLTEEQLITLKGLTTTETDTGDGLLDLGGADLGEAVKPNADGTVSYDKVAGITTDSLKDTTVTVIDAQNGNGISGGFKAVQLAEGTELNAKGTLVLNGSAEGGNLVQDKDGNVASLRIGGQTSKATSVVTLGDANAANKGTLGNVILNAGSGNAATLNVVGNGKAEFTIGDVTANVSQNTVNVAGATLLTGNITVDAGSNTYKDIDLNVTNGTVNSQSAEIANAKLANGTLTAASKDAATGGNITISNTLSGQGSVVADKTLALTNGYTGVDTDALALQANELTTTAGFDSTKGDVVIKAAKWDANGATTLKGDTVVLTEAGTFTNAFAMDGGALVAQSENADTSATLTFKDNATFTNGAVAVADSIKMTDTGKTLTVGTGDDTVGGTTLSAQHIDLNGGMLLVDPAWGLASSNVAVESLSAGSVGVGRNSYLALGTADTGWLPGVVGNYTKGVGLSETGITAALGVFKGIEIAADKNLTVDGSKTGTEIKTGWTSSGATNSATFADNSLLVINGQNIYGDKAAISFKNPGTLSVAEGAKLLVTDAVAGQTYTIVGNVNDPAAALAGWKNNGMTSTTDMISLGDAVFNSANQTVTTSATRNDAHTVFPNLSDGMANAVNDLYTGHAGAAGQPNWDYADVNSDQMGVRFLSRATDNRFLGMDKNAAAESIESAARIAFAGAAPQMTRMASDAATNSVVNRLGFANPADGAQAMDAEGKIVDRNTTGFALWIAPLWQSQHGWGLDAGNMDYGFNGNLGGVSLGADYTFENAIRAGITFNIGGGYAESSGGDLSSTDNRMNFWGLGAYAGWNYENFGVMADVSYTSTWNQLKQDLDSRLGMGNKLEADVQASAISAGLRAEYLLQTSAMDIIPHIGVRYMSLNTWGYDVDTHGGTVLEGDSLHQDIWTFPIGVTFSKDFALDSGWNFKPSLDFTVIPAAGDIKAKHDVHFTGLPGTYEVETQMMDYLTWQGGVGLELANDNMSIGVNYTLQAGQHTTGHGVFGSFRYEF